MNPLHPALIIISLPLHSTKASSVLRDMYEVYNREVTKLGFDPCRNACIVTTYHYDKLIIIREKETRMWAKKSMLGDEDMNPRLVSCK